MYEDDGYADAIWYEMQEREAEWDDSDNANEGRESVLQQAPQDDALAALRQRFLGVQQ